MKRASHLLVGLSALLFLVLAGCQFTEPSLEINIQEAYNSQSDILIQARFVAENDAHTCSYELKDSGDITVPGTEGTSVLPAETWNDLPLFDVASDGKYLFDFCVLDGEGAAIDCLHEEVGFWVDSVPSVAIAPTYWKTEDTVPFEIWTVKLNDHPDNSDPELSPVTIYYNLSDGSAPDPDISSMKYDPEAGIVVSAIAPPVIKTIAVDAVGHQSTIAEFNHFVYGL